MQEKIVNLLAEAECFTAENKYKESIDVYKQIVDIDNNNENAKFQIGELFHRLGDLTMALNYYIAVVDANPKHEKANVKIDMINSIMGYFNSDMHNP